MQLHPKKYFFFKVTLQHQLVNKRSQSICIPELILILVLSCHVLTPAGN